MDVRPQKAKAVIIDASDRQFKTGITTVDRAFNAAECIPGSAFKGKIDCRVTWGGDEAQLQATCEQCNGCDEDYKASLRDAADNEALAMPTFEFKPGIGKLITLPIDQRWKVSGEGVFRYPKPGERWAAKAEGGADAIVIAMDDEFDRVEYHDLSSDSVRAAPFLQFHEQYKDLRNQ